MKKLITIKATASDLPPKAGDIIVYEDIDGHPTLGVYNFINSSLYKGIKKLYPKITITKEKTYTNSQVEEILRQWSSYLFNCHNDNEIPMNYIEWFKSQGKHFCYLKIIK